MSALARSTNLKLLSRIGPQNWLRFLTTKPQTEKTLRVASSPRATFSYANTAEFIAAAGSPESIPRLVGLPEVIVAGRANAGKSTLLNAVLGRKNLVHTSKKPGRTKELNFFRVGTEPGKLIVVDAPGYGARGRQEWGELFNHYIQYREQLKRVYILFNAKNETLNKFDARMLRHLSTMLISSRGGQPFTLQAIITKADTVPPENIEKVVADIREQIWEAAPLCLPPLITSASMSPPFGIDEVRENIIDACGV